MTGGLFLFLSPEQNGDNFKKKSEYNDGRSESKSQETETVGILILRHDEKTYGQYGNTDDHQDIIGGGEG